MHKILALCCGFLLYTSVILAQEVKNYQIDEAQYQLKIYSSFDSFAHHLETSSDSIMVVNFWATWCKPCVAELPYFEMLNDKYANEGVGVTLVSLDFKRQIESKLIPFLQKHQLNSKVVLLLDSKEQEWIDKVDANWSGAIPITLIFTKYKRLFLEQDFSDFESLEQELINFKNK